MTDSSHLKIPLPYQHTKSPKGDPWEVLISPKGDPWEKEPSKDILVQSSNGRFLSPASSAILFYMKLIYSIATLLLFLTPTYSYAAWYWLSNPSYPEQGDFVELSALEYAQFESNDLLTLVKDETIRTIDKLEHFKECEQVFDSIMNSFQMQSFETLNYWLTKGGACVAQEERLEKISEALNECDLEYVVEKSRGSELVGYGDKIQKCKEEAKTSIATIEPKNVGILVTTEEVATTQPVPPVAVQTPIKEIVQVPQAIISEEVSVQDETIEEDIVIVEKIEESFVETEVQNPHESNKISFFQKIKNFFYQIFNW